MRLARQTSTPLYLSGDGVRLFDGDGNHVDPARAMHLQELVWSLFKESFGYSLKHGSEISADDSLHRYIRKRIAECDVPDSDRELLVQLSQMWGDYTGDPIQRQSLKYVWTETVCGGGKRIRVIKTMACDIELTSRRRVFRNE